MNTLSGSDRRLSLHMINRRVLRQCVNGTEDMTIRNASFLLNFYALLYLHCIIFDFPYRHYALDEAYLDIVIHYLSRTDK